MLVLGETSFKWLIVCAMRAKGAQRARAHDTPAAATIATAPWTWEMKRVDHMSAAKRRWEASQYRRRVRPWTGRSPVGRRTGRKRFAARETKDSRRRAKE